MSLSSSVLFLSLLLPEGKTLLPLRFPALVRALASLLFGGFPLQTQGLLGPGAGGQAGQLALDLPLNPLGIFPGSLFLFLRHGRAEPQAVPMI